MALFVREVIRRDPELAKHILEESGVASMLAELSGEGEMFENAYERKRNERKAIKIVARKLVNIGGPSGPTKKSPR